MPMCSHIQAAHTPALLVHFNLELYDHPPYSPHFTPSDCNLFTYLNNWFGSQRFNNNELIKGVKMWLCSSQKQQAALSQAHNNVVPNMTSTSIPPVIMLRSSLSMYVFFVHNNFFHCFFC
jgi:hypothetical protein